MHTTIEKKKKERGIRCEEKVLLFPHHIKILFLFVRLISERGLRRK